jgi:hypothetical protein
MTPQHHAAKDVYPDPFGERSASLAVRRHLVLGADVQFESHSRRLLRLVDAAYADLPPHRLSRAVPHLRVRLLLIPDLRTTSSPPALAMFAGAGLLVGAAGSSGLVIISARDKTALVALPANLLHFPYYVRYELIEFAVFTLASRVQGLVPLHAACVGQGGHALLLMGPSGSGKSTLALHCLLEGFDFVSEDSAFVVPDTLLATGVANFLHVRADSLRWLGQSRHAKAIRRSPVIRRRSGVRKFEVDLRREGYRLAPRALTTAAIVFLSARSTGAGPLLTSLPRSRFLARLEAMQAYAAGQPSWVAFTKAVEGLDAFELRRGRHPHEGVEILGRLLRSRGGRPGGRREGGCASR